MEKVGRCCNNCSYATGSEVNGEVLSSTRHKCTTTKSKFFNLYVYGDRVCKSHKYLVEHKKGK